MRDETGDEARDERINVKLLAWWADDTEQVRSRFQQQQLAGSRVRLVAGGGNRGNDDDEVDYFVVLQQARHDDSYDADRTIVFQLSRRPCH